MGPNQISDEQFNERHLYVEVAWLSVAYTLDWYYLSVFALALNATPLHLGLLTSGRALLMTIGAAAAPRWRCHFADVQTALRIPLLSSRGMLFFASAFVPLLGEYAAEWLVIVAVISAFPEGIGQNLILSIPALAVCKDRLPTVVARRSVIMNAGVLVSVAAFGVLLESI
jgi:hypothetical protein